MYPSSFLERVHIKIIIMYPIMLFFWLMKSQPWKGNEHKISKSNQSQSIMKRHVSTQSRVPPPPPPLLLHVNDRHFFFLVHQPLPPYLVASSRHSKKIYRSPTMASDLWGFNSVPYFIKWQAPHGNCFPTTIKKKNSLTWSQLPFSRLGISMLILYL